MAVGGHHTARISAPRHYPNKATRCDVRFVVLDLFGSSPMSLSKHLVKTQHAKEGSACRAQAMLPPEDTSPVNSTTLDLAMYRACHKQYTHSHYNEFHEAPLPTAATTSAGVASGHEPERALHCARSQTSIVRLRRMQGNVFVRVLLVSFLPCRRAIENSRLQMPRAVAAMS